MALLETLLLRGPHAALGLPSSPRQRPGEVRAEAATFVTFPIIGWSAILSLAATLASILPSSATTVDVTDQAGFDAAVQAAITTGQPNTIDIHIPSPNTISSGTGLVLPGLASPLNLNFATAPDFGIGYNSIGNLTIGPNTNLNFAPTRRQRASCGIRGSSLDFRFWHIASLHLCTKFGSLPAHAGHWPSLS
jgi:hypothetical protein